MKIDVYSREVMDLSFDGSIIGGIEFLDGEGIVKSGFST